MKKTEWKSPALLFLTAVVWGVAFVAQSVGMDYVGPFTFNCIRCLIGAVVLVPCIWFLDGWKQRPDGASCGRESAGASCGRESTGAPSGASYGSHALLAGGICCGLALFVASNLQQIGIQRTGAVPLRRQSAGALSPDTQGTVYPAALQGTRRDGCRAALGDDPGSRAKDVAARRDRRRPSGREHYKYAHGHRSTAAEGIYI